MKQIKINSISDLEKAAVEFLSLMGSNKIFAFHGEMGAGKTTFIKAICMAMGVSENITSPTFSLVNEYRIPSGSFIYHFDCYRLKNIAEAYDIGTEEYFYSGNYCFIEWPEKIEELLPETTVAVTITVTDNNHRIVTLNI